MTSPASPGAGDAGDPETTRIPTQSGGTDIAGTAQPVDDRRAAAAAVLDQPLDDDDLASRVHRPGMARSTRILLVVLIAVGLVALGTWIGRATAHFTGTYPLPDSVGTVESVQNGADGGQITVRGADGTLTVFSTSPGTKVATAAPDGLSEVHQGQQVTVSGQHDRSGANDATLVQLANS